MATSIRLKRVGAKKEASYRIVVVDSREGTSGASVERLGLYNPRTRPSLIRVNAARTLYWLHEGAEPSDTVRSLLRKTGIWKQFHDGVTGEGLEDEIVFLGPAADARGTSQRPMPTDRPAEAEAAPAGKGGKAAAKPAKSDAEAASEAEEAPAAETEEAPVAEAEEAPAAEAEEAEAEATSEAEPVGEAADEAEEREAEADEEAPAAEAETAEEAEPVSEATAEAEEPEAEADEEEKP